MLLYKPGIVTAIVVAGALSREISVETAHDAIDQENWEAAAAKAMNLISKLNLTEKASLVTGTANGNCIGNLAPIDRVDFGGLRLSDGPQGLHLADMASVFPLGLTVAATWDRELIARRGAAMGAKFRDKSANVMLGPSTGPLGRSSWEGFSPDTYLSGVAMQATIRSAQAVGVQACAKHFIGNEQETHRTNSQVDGVDVAAASANIDDRTLHELYLWPFADAVKAGVSSFMCSYNRVNMTYSCANEPILNQILRDELGFKGYMMSDWFSTHSGAKDINAGLDLNMPGFTS
ncbi:beta-glucosidase [Aspergillus affinis]|uniref:beta-glucosidase n=1 Tax=Aspergillus affinis TaxID=1070780 RepID=UPI0022FE77C7|nr:beta-glucosidase [Aspergillus affinis]KAI9045982.1 beta-glucosidase [Aspergillus affinis]